MRIGAAVAREASSAASSGHAVEKSGEGPFEFEYGENFGTHLEAFRPRFGKHWCAGTPRTTRP